MKKYRIHTHAYNTLLWLETVGTGSLTSFRSWDELRRHLGPDLVNVTVADVVSH